MTARELISKIAPNNPGKRWAVNQGTTSYEAESSIAVWHNGEWVLVLGKVISGGWAQIPNLLINGKPAVSDWVEVQSNA
ncbi:MAG: hypothetical protein QM757_26495 [Paludibaculum sp.]